MFSISTSLRGYDDLFARLIAAIPSGDFYDDFSKPIIAWNALPTNLVLNSDQFEIPVNITVERLGDYHPNVDQQNVITETTIVPNNYLTNFRLTLGRGLNRITAKEQISGGRAAYLEVIATTNALVLEPEARELFVSDNLYNNQKSAIFSRQSTRLLDQVLTFQNLLTGIEALKVLTTRLVTRGFVHFPARQIGIRNIIESFALNTPAFRDSRDFFPYEIERSRILRTEEIAAGEEAHVWFPNLSVTRWLAFLRMADSLRQNYKVLNIRDDRVTVRYKGEDQVHRFDFNSEGSNFLTNLSVGDCFNNIDVSFNMHLLMDYRWCVWAYFLDEFVTPESAIGNARTMFDLGIPFDTGRAFDADPVDPYTDGWVGWSLSGRFEQDVRNTVDARYALDTHVVASRTYTGKQCVYDRGPYTQMMNSINIEVPLQHEVEIQSADWEDTYTQNPIVGLGMTIPSGPLVAGQPYLSAVKYVDQNDMTNSTGSGQIHLQESAGGDEEDVPVASGGFQWFYLTPTKSGDVYWDLSDGALTGQSETRVVLPSTFAKFVISNIGPQQVGVPFNLTIQAADQFGNPVTDVGINTTVQINAVVGFFPGAVTPTSVTLINGTVTVQITMTQAGTGAIRCSLLPVQTDSNIFTVT